MNRFFNSLTILTFLFIIVGCKKLRTSWTKEGYEGRYFASLAVLSLEADAEERTTYEKYTIDLLVEKGIKAIPGSVIGLDSITSNLDLESLILENNLDGILTIGLTKREEGGILPEDYNKFSKFHSHRFTELNTQRYLVSGGKYVMEGLLHDLKVPEDNDLVWRGEMAMLDPNSANAKERFIRRAVNQLVSEKLLTTQ